MILSRERSFQPLISFERKVKAPLPHRIEPAKKYCSKDTFSVLRLLRSRDFHVTFQDGHVGYKLFFANSKMANTDDWLYNDDLEVALPGVRIGCLVWPRAM